MKRAMGSSIAVVVLAGLGLLPARAEEPASPGRSAFLAQKCDLCHSVPAAGIESKMKSATMKGPDLGPAVSQHDPKLLRDFLRKQGQLGGKDHKKEFTGTDAELAAVLAWLGGLKG